MRMSKAAVLPLLVLILTACGNNDDTAPDISVTESETMTETVSETSEEIVTESDAGSETEQETPEKNMSAENEALTETVSEAVSTVIANDYKSLYKAKLSEMCEYEEYEPLISTFDLYDIDGDGVPELFLAFGDYHAAGVFVYTVRDGEVVQLCTSDKEYFGSWGRTMVNSSGFLASRYFGMGSDYADYFRLENGQLTLMVSSEHHMQYMGFPDESEPEQDKFVIDGNEVSEEEYSSAVGEYEALEWTSVGQGNRFFDLEDGERIIDEYGK